MKILKKSADRKLVNHNASINNNFKKGVRKESTEGLSENYENKNELFESKIIIKNFFDAISNKQDVDQSSKLQSLSKMVSSVIELEKEGVLDKKEADVLVEFVVGKFVESKFDKILDNLQLKSDFSWFVAHSSQNIFK